ncbi:tRNA-dependent cyclodipeptide synthase [Vibrio tetraodonis]|uniref:tRNA-dependent cyclodipeptide synthase n=1 Tax=Vibrio tetraodonis TaxID=2231647 RepID=UPI0013B3CD1C|nr:tRNA-dependent cyclodipeptide synthase [Vibrio tetraodonis]
MTDFYLSQKEVIIVQNNHIEYYQSGLKKLEHQPMVVGLSPGNGFYSKENILSLVKGLCSLVPKLLIIIPDVIHVHNFRGMGYSEELAIKKAGDESRRLENRLTHVTSLLTKELNLDNFHVLDWQKDIEESQSYQRSVDKILTHYHANHSFRTCIEAVSNRYIESKAKHRTLIKLDINQAVMYYLKELALFASMPNVIGEHTTISYHQLWQDGIPYLEEIYPSIKSHLSLVQYQLE